MQRMVKGLRVWWPGGGRVSTISKCLSIWRLVVGRWHKWSDCRPCSMCFFFAGAVTLRIHREILDIRKQVTELQH